MLYRYKVTKQYDPWEGIASSFMVKIQYYKPNAYGSNWKKFEDASLLHILMDLGNLTGGFTYTVTEVCNAVNKYESMNHIVTEYIKKELSHREYKKECNKLEDALDEFVGVGCGWSTIEIEEDVND